METLPNRPCGECTACCHFIPIDDPKLHKPTNVLCPHVAVGQGCTVYDLRPGPCRGWECLWKALETIPQDWRPDQSGLVFRPEGLHTQPFEITVTVLEPDKMLMSEQFASLVSGWMEGGISVALQAVGPPGHFPSKLAMNAYILPVVKSRNLKAFQSVLSDMYRAITTDFRWQPDGIVLSSSVVSSV